MRSERIEKIEEYIYKNKTVTLNQLCEIFNVSKNTIRRDIDEIVSNSSIKKIYGGVSAPIGKELSSFNDRNVQNISSKKRIGAFASTLISDGDIIFIDSGTTTRHMFEGIKNKNNLTILTNNLELINSAIPYDGLRIISLSGTLNRKTMSFTGPSAADVLQNYNITKAFMASTGISMLSGATNASLEECVIKKAVIARSKTKYLLIDRSKFDVTALMTFCSLELIDGIITDAKPPQAYIDYFAENGHMLHICD